MRLEDLKLYQESLTFSNKVWTLVSKLNDLEKEMIGKKLVNAADAISSNLSQGYGRYYFKEKKQFCYESRSFILETKDWLNKAKERGLIDEADYEDLIEHSETLLRMLSGYIKSIGRKKDGNRSSSSSSEKYSADFEDLDDEGGADEDEMKDDDGNKEYTFM